MKKILLAFLLLAGRAHAQQLNPIPADSITSRAFLDLGTPPPGVLFYCPNCAATSPCTSGTAGAYAFRTASTWECSSSVPAGGQASFAQQSGSSTAIASSEMATNAAFTSDLTGWTGTNWSFSAGTALHSAGSTSALSQNVSITSGNSYLITYTVVGGTVGSLSIDLGAQSIRTGVISGVSGSEIRFITATAGGSVALAATPTTDFDGSLTYFGIQEFTAEAAVALDFRDSTGTSWAKIRGIGTGGNIFFGPDAGRFMQSSGSGGGTTGIGANALRAQTNSGSTVIGNNANRESTNGTFNVAIGRDAMTQASATSQSVAVGRSAMQNSRTGSQNVAIGYEAGLGLLYGNNNTFVGWDAGTLVSATAAVPAGGTGNTLIGSSAGIGANGITTGTNNTIVGTNATQGSTTQRTNSAAFGAGATYDCDNCQSFGSTAVTQSYFGGQTTPASNLNSQSVTPLRGIRGGSLKTLTDAGAAVAVWACTLPTADFMGGQVEWATKSTDGTDHRSTAGTIRVAGVNKAGTNTCTINVVGTDLTASSNANTLVCTWTNVAAGAVCNISVTCTDNTAAAQTMSVTSRPDMPLAQACVPQ